MTDLREVITDADFEAWRSVRLAILPGERTATVEELKAMDRPGRLMLLAEQDGDLVGHGVASRSDLAGRGSVTPRVLPPFRRRGIGTEMLRVLIAHTEAQGYPRVSSLVEDDGSLAFAQRFGFAEVDRQIEQLRAIGAEPMPPTPPGVEIVTVAQRPSLWAAAYRQVGFEAVKDMAVVSPLQVTLEQWESEWINTPEATFLAMAGADVVGLASLHLDSDVPHRAEQGFTAVHRDWRGRGIASTLKRMTLWWAAEHGISEVYTWTQNGNENMRRLNEHLGFRNGAWSIDVVAPLPLAAFIAAGR
ncbi:MAG TPA: GNAT family N-acetyltransferase [Candidatus Limnocylindria bacterium]|nr:GNAT family N-acetyltransferase [Candidatus Limnocylindria bacterium]